MGTLHLLLGLASTGGLCGRGFVFFVCAASEKRSLCRALWNRLPECVVSHTVMRGNAAHLPWTVSRSHGTVSPHDMPQIMTDKMPLAHAWRLSSSLGLRTM